MKPHVLTLKGKTQRGKNVVQRDGLWWAVLKEKDSIPMTNEPGPWWLIEPKKAGVNKATQSRWIHGKQDINFEVVRLITEEDVT